jgi:predicted DNA-binding transcriptional regulator
MLEIIDDIQPFIEDNYRRINIREYARIRGISPPTASKTLSRLHREGLLKKEIDRQYHLPVIGLLVVTPQQIRHTPDEIRKPISISHFVKTPSVKIRSIPPGDGCCWRTDETSFLSSLRDWSGWSCPMSQQ